jgi:uncharacterized membrane protein
MPHLLNHLFAAVCGQNPDHTWAPGGMLLPCCQRCLGLYVGACGAMLLHCWLRPRPSARFLAIHGAFLLLMAPFGFHWLPQGPVLRALTGVLFGFGLVAFLGLPLTERARWTHSTRFATYAAGLTAMLALLPLLAAYGGRAAAYALCGLATGGAAALGALVLADSLLALAGFFRLVRAAGAGLGVSGRSARTGANSRPPASRPRAS